VVGGLDEQSTKFGRGSLAESAAASNVGGFRDDRSRPPTEDSVRECVRRVRESRHTADTVHGFIYEVEAGGFAKSPKRLSSQCIQTDSESAERSGASR
jgi:hypothetical protein